MRRVTPFDARGYYYYYGSAAGNRRVAALGGTPFSPESIAGLDVWYDPSDLSTLFQDAAMTTPVTANDDPVGAILDKSGNDRHATQSTANNRPLYKTSGGLHWLEFDGTNDSLTALFALSQPINRVGAYQFITVDINYRMLVGGGTGAGDMLFSLNTTSLRMFAGTEVEFATNPAAGTDIVVTELFSGASSQGAIDNGSYTVVNPGTGATDGITLGDQGDGAGFANCRHYGLVQRGSAFSAAEIAQLRTYYGGKQGRVL
jgi:hypothetical protein